jgi:hypothetical protein
MIERQVRVALATAALQPCLLCGDPSVFVAMFIPNAEHVWSFGGEPGRERFIFYALCAPCRVGPDAPEAAEAVFLRAYGRRREGSRR